MSTYIAWSTGTQTTDPVDRPVKLQGLAYTSILSGIYPDDLCNLIHRRLCGMFPKLQWEIDDVDFSELRTFVGYPSVSWATVLIKTWVNGCRRFQENDPCILGCPDAQETVAHYTICNLLWHAVRAATRNATGDRMLHRMCVIDPDLHRTFNFCVGFHGDHALHKETFTASLSDVFRNHRIRESYILGEIL